MAKTYVDNVKYTIVTEFEIQGIVDKPDIIGAVFGQSEGLLGEEMDLRELQKSGRIGRIEIQSSADLGKTKGVMTVPSAMDMVETSLLAAAIEAVDKVGPFEAKFQTQKIEDTRQDKRKEIADRAKLLLQKFMATSSTDTQALADSVRENARAANLEEWGPDKLACGPEIETSDEIIVVEGRADVVTLLKNSVKNVISMGGAKPPESLIRFLQGKKVTVFIDGDRGGLLNLRKLADLVPIANVARAPDGKEVEELERKEINMALRRSEKLEDALHKAAEDNGTSYRAPMEGRGRGFGRGAPRAPYGPRRTPEFGERSFSRERAPYGSGPSRGRPMGRGPPRGGRGFDRPPSRGFGGGFGRGPPRYGGFRQFEEDPQLKALDAEMASKGWEEIPKFSEPSVSTEEKDKFKPLIAELKGSLKAKLFDDSFKEIKTVPVRELLKALPDSNAKIVALDGIVTKRLLDEAKKYGIHTIAGVKKGKIENTSGIKVVTADA
ncbi:MAG: DNA primase DnaG [Candidatus Diapherotrites archaeon]